MSLQQRVIQRFRDQFDAPPPFVVRAPGRVNLIGEHTDYNDGFVLPMAIDRAIWIALRPRDDGTVWIHSLDFDEDASFSLSALQHGSGDWVEYPKGVAWALQGAGYHLRGWEGIVAGDVPLALGSPPPPPWSWPLRGPLPPPRTCPGMPRRWPGWARRRRTNGWA